MCTYFYLLKYLCFICFAIWNTFDDAKLNIKEYRGAKILTRDFKI